ncbi:MAG: homoserine O-succinyltransferase [Acidimicrobiales bacterium]|jgi:homoserine O-succinyltransferase
MVEISIVGLGPWGLCALERFVDAARRTPESDVVVHIVEPGRPGGGMYSLDHPDYLVLNTPCGQHSLYPFPEALDDVRLGRGFYEWVQDRGYRWQGVECWISTVGTPVGPHDFLPRRLMGEYLRWFYQVLCAEAPANITIKHHQTSAVDVEATGDGRERVYLGNGDQLVVDEVVLTTGHVQDLRNMGSAGPLATSPYPIEAYLGSTGPDDKVAIEGMGLVALDVITALTIGLGGRYTDGEDGQLVYHPSGREPSIYLFSRSGLPYCAKSFATADPVGDYEPGICTTEAVAALKRHEDGTKRYIDARHELLPLVFAEMELCYYVTAARRDEGPEEARRVRELLVEAWASGTFADAKDLLAGKYGEFSAEAHLFAGKDAHYSSAQDYQAKMRLTLETDLAEALVTGGPSPLKAALETLRALRDTLRLAVEFKGLNLTSHVDFQVNMHSRLSRLVAGPPAFRSQQLLALMHAGVLSLPFGPSPELLPAEAGRIQVRSTRLDQPFELEVDRLVRAHMDQPSISRSTNPLFTNLVRRGRARPLDFDGTPVGSIDLTEDFHPLDVSGRPAEHLWVFGVLSEGVRYFTLYIPSPKSRVRAFIDADFCANQVVGRGRVIELSGPIALDGPGASAASAPAGLGAGRRGGAAGPQRALRLAFVNSMPDGAFEETERQFEGLLGAASAGQAISFQRFSLPGIVRSPGVQALIAAGYKPVEDLYADPPDAVIVTGAEPKQPELTEELFWPAMEGLLRWLAEAVPSALVSCLSAHAAMWAFHRVPRRMLLDKSSGVFEQSVDHSHPLMAGVGGTSWPHSRFNDVPAPDLLENGYQVLAESRDGGWTVALGEQGQCQLLLLQGHPEYGPYTLLREYRRDVRRYLSGVQGSYPRVPNDLVDSDGVEVLTEFETKLSQKGRDPALMQDFPFDFAARHVTARWDAASGALIGNWLASVRQRSDQRLYIDSGA